MADVRTLWCHASAPSSPQIVTSAAEADVAFRIARREARHIGGVRVLKQTIAICAGVLASSWPCDCGRAARHGATGLSGAIPPGLCGHRRRHEVTAIVRSTGLEAAHAADATRPGLRAARARSDRAGGARRGRCPQRRIIAVRPVFGPRYAGVPPYGRPPAGVPLAAMATVPIRASRRCRRMSTVRPAPARRCRLRPGPQAHVHRCRPAHATWRRPPATAAPPDAARRPHAADRACRRDRRRCRGRGPRWPPPKPAAPPAAKPAAAALPPAPSPAAAPELKRPASRPAPSPRPLPRRRRPRPSEMHE